MPKIRLNLPKPAYELLEQGAKEAKMAVEEFACVCIYSCLANYAQSSEPQPDEGMPDNPVFKLDLANSDK
jgi:hypothetical protein